MSTEEFDIDSLTLDVGNIGLHPSDIIAGGAENSPRIHYFEPGYTGKIDYRVRQLSYSSVTTLHSCPRRYQLYKLRTSAGFIEAEDAPASITFAFGHVVGLGIQLVLEGRNWDEILWRCFLEWDCPLFARQDRDKKSFWEAIFAVEKFKYGFDSGYLAGWELVSYRGKLATELSFCITFPDGFRYRGHVDAVLRHSGTGKVMVLECKTTKYTTVNPAMYKNSAQAIGYSIVLDALFPELSSYEVLYLVYQSTAREFTKLPFEKTYLQRAQWIRELLMDIDQIKVYEEAELYPMHGESCFSFSRECEYLNVCTLNTNYLTKPCTEGDLDKIEYEVNITLMDLLKTQLEKTNA